MGRGLLGSLGKLPTVTPILAPNIHIDAPNRFHIDAPSRFRIDAPNIRIDAPNIRIDAPKIRIHAPNRFRIHAFDSACIFK